MKPKITAKEVFLIQEDLNNATHYEAMPNIQAFNISFFEPDEVQTNRLGHNMARKCAIIKAIKEQQEITTPFLHIETISKIEELGMTRLKVTPLQKRREITEKEVKSRMHVKTMNDTYIGWSSYKTA